MNNRKIAGTAALLVAGLLGWAVWWLLASTQESLTGMDRAGTRHDPSADAVIMQSLRVDLPNSATPLRVPLEAHVAESTLDQERGMDDRPGEPISLFGRVVDPRGAPIQFALVTFVPDLITLEAWGLVTRDSFDLPDDLDVTTLPSVFTAEDGSYQLDAKAVFGTSYFGFVDPAEIVVTHADFATRVVPCSALVQSGRLTLDAVVLERGARLIGRVVDERAAPRPGVQVSVPWSSVEPQVLTGEFHRGALHLFQRAETDSAGRFSLTGLWQGRVAPRFSAPGSRPSFGAGQLSVVAGETLDIGDVELGLGQVIAGVALDTSGRPVAGATVMAVSPDELRPREGYDVLAPVLRRGSSTSALSSDDGTFLLSGLAAGRLGVVVHASGFSPWSRRRVDVGEAGLQVVLQRARALRLSVVDADTGRRLSEAIVVAHRREHSAERTIRTGDELMLLDAEQARRAGFSEPAAGEFLLAPMGPHGVLLDVTAPGYGRSRSVVQSASADLESRHTLRLAAARRVQGVVLCELGDPVAGASVKATDPTDGIELSEALTDAAGAYALEGLGTEALTVIADAPGRLQSGPLLPSFDSDGEAKLDIVLVTGATLRGTLYDSDGSGLAGEPITVISADGGGLMFSVRSDRGGGYEFSGLPAGEVLLAAEDAREVALRIEPPEVVEQDLHVREEAVIRGLVLAGRQPVPDALVRLVRVWEQDGLRLEHPLRSSRTDDSGAFMFTADAGEVGLSASTADGITPRRDLFLHWGDVVELDLVVGSHTLAGTVVEASTGRPVRSARLELTHVPSESVIAVLTGADGRFRFSHLVPGRYTGRCTADGFFDEPLGPFDLLAHTASEPLEVRLATEAVLRGALVYEDGRAVDEGTEVLLYPVGAPFATERTTSRSGAYELGVGRPGAYRVEVRPPFWSLSVNGRDDPPLAERTVSIVTGDLIQLDLTIPAEQ